PPGVPECRRRPGRPPQSGPRRPSRPLHRHQGPGSDHPGRSARRGRRRPHPTARGPQPARRLGLGPVPSGAGRVVGELRRPHLVTAPTLAAAGRVDVAGVSTALIDAGTPVGAAAPPLLLLHGSGPGVAATANWRPIIPAVAAGRRVIAPDQLGFGRTATGERPTHRRDACADPAPAL